MLAEIILISRGSSDKETRVRILQGWEDICAPVSGYHSGGSRDGDLGW